MISVWKFLISSDYVRGIGASKFLVIQGCFNALSEVYLSIGDGLHNLRKKSLAKVVKPGPNFHWGDLSLFRNVYSLSTYFTYSGCFPSINIYIIIPHAHISILYLTLS